MKVVALHASMPAFEQGLNNISQIFKNTFFELGVEVEEINLSLLDIRFFDGVKSQAVENILRRIDNSDGVIIESTAVLNMPCGLFQTFIEHLGYGVYSNVFDGKKCFCISVSSDGSEKRSCDYIMDVIAEFGGIDAGRMTICSEDAKVAIGETSIKETVEKYAEDLYRILRQERRFFVPKKKTVFSNMARKDDFAQDVAKVLGHEPKPKKIKSSEILEQIDYNSFNERQEEDIKEISRFLTNQYNSEKEKVVVQKNDFTNVYNEMGFNSEVVPHIKSCRQRTQSLHHYFQPQLAGGINAVIQINVKGDEKFEGYLKIYGSECEYVEGVHENPDVTVFSDCNVWLDILNGKYTIQKAFMIGQIKVRGNFVLMTKFDQLFKMQK